MKKINTNSRILAISRRELHIFAHRPLFLFVMIVAPVICVIYLTTLMSKGLPTKLPAGIVDEDNTHITHTAYRTLNTLEETEIKYHFASFSEARKAMQEGKIFAFFYFRKGTTEKAIAGRQPEVSFFTNEAYFVPGTLLMKDMRTAGELIGLAITREELYLRGANEDRAMGVIRPIVTENHPLNNSCLDYSVYLNNILVPGIFILLIMLSTTYVIGIEWKMETQKQWYAMSGHRASIALAGKLLPQTLLFFLIVVFYDVYFYRILHFPCNCGLFPIILIGWLTVLASQAFGIFMFGLNVGMLRLSLCMCSLWGILSFSLAGFTYPVMAMSPIMRVLSWLFPLRHYYLLYVNQALDGFPVLYVWPSLVSLLAFMLLPYLVLWRYRYAFLYIKYRS